MRKPEYPGKQNSIKESPSQGKCIAHKHRLSFSCPHWEWSTLWTTDADKGTVTRHLRKDSDLTTYKSSSCICSAVWISAESLLLTPDIWLDHSNPSDSSQRTGGFVQSEQTLTSASAESFWLLVIAFFGDNSSCSGIAQQAQASECVSEDSCYLTLLCGCQPTVASCWQSRPGRPSYPMTLTAGHLAQAIPELKCPYLKRWSHHQFDPCASWRSRSPEQAEKKVNRESNTTL